jgi:MFS family permease
MENSSKHPNLSPQPSSPRSSHSLNTLFGPLSLLFERLAFYSILRLIWIYLIEPDIGLEYKEADRVTEGFLLLLVVFKLIGGVLGDFALGRKWLMLSGQLLQALGAFALCVPHLWGVYLGLFLIALGSGLYSPNVLASLGSSYRSNTTHLAAGFGLAFLTTLLGASFTYSLLNWLEHDNFRLSFALAGVFSLIASVLSVFVKESPKREWPKLSVSFKPSTAMYLVGVLLIAGLVSFSSYLIEHVWRSLGEGKNPISLGPFKFPYHEFSLLTLYLTLPLLLLEVLVLHFVNLNYFLKLAVGILLLLVSGLSTLLMTPLMMSWRVEEAFPLLFPMLAMAFSDAIIGPMQMATIGRHAPIRLMGTFFALQSFSIWLLNKVTLTQDIDGERVLPQRPLVMGIGIAVIALATAVTLWLITRRMEKREVATGQSHPPTV